MNSYAVVAVLFVSFNIKIFWGSTNSPTSELLVVRIQYYYKVSQDISDNNIINICFQRWNKRVLDNLKVQFSLAMS